MAEKTTNGGSLHWPALITILVATGGAYFFVSPLNSSRPNAEPGKKVVSLGYEDREAHLWQDPFQAAAEDENEKTKAAAATQPSAPLSPPAINAYMSVVTGGEEASASSQPLLQATTRPERVGSEKSELDGPTHDWGDIVRQLKERTDRDSITIMPVLVQAGPYAELGEQRLRLRVAVLDALALHNYIPEDAEHIGAVATGWAWQSFRDPKKDRLDIASAMERGSQAARLLIPYEWSYRIKNGKRDDVLILWLNENAFGDLPLTRLSALCAKIRQTGLKNVQFKIIGPRVSTVLRAMAEEASQGLSQTTIEQLRDAQMFSATATAAEDILLANLNCPESAKGCTTVSQLIDNRMGPRKLAPFLNRLTLTDSDMCREVITELERRKGVRIRRDEGNEKPHLSHVVLVCEWDTFYARSLLKTFKVQANEPDGKYSWISTRYYLRGIDGQIPAINRRELSAERERTKTEKNEKSLGYPERPEGMSGLDYLRRLADDLTDYDQRLRADENQSEESGIQVVGVLGNDVYDKLLVLRALRDRLPNVHFFTIGMDARYGLGSEWSAAHNLLICSNFGLQLNERFQQSMPPFRDNSQTAAFASVQFALHEDQKMPKDVSTFVTSMQPSRLYTIGRSGPVDLSTSYALLHPQRPLRLPWLHGSRAHCLTITAVAVALLLLMPIIFGVRPERVRRSAVLTETAPFLVWAVPLAFVLVIGLYAHDDPLQGEPFAWADGISIWPTEIVRLIVTLLCVHFFFRCRRLIKDNEAMIENEFRLLPRLEPGACWPVISREERYKEPKGVVNAMRDPSLAEFIGHRSWYARLKWFFRRVSLANWKAYGPADTSEVKEDWVNRAEAVVCPDDRTAKDQTPEMKVFAQNLWWEYKLRSSWHRFFRVVVVAGVYIGAAYLVSMLLGFPRSPARSEYAQRADARILMSSVIASVLLTFFVLDATYLNKRFIEHLMKKNTHWPHGVFENEKFKEMQLSLDLTEYLDIRFIAKRTEAVGDIIYYPFVLFFLMIVSRNSLFDDWDWPMGLIVIFAANISLAVIGALMLRGAAERARRRALADLGQRHRKFLAESKDQQAKLISELISEVEGERGGAFSLLSQHPVLAAILLPSGSIGVWALLEYFARNIG